jgi:hypothetical protein
MPSKIEFPKTLAPEGRFFDRRFIKEDMSKTLIWPLNPEGTRTTQYDPTACLGVYVWVGKHWELEGVYNTRREAKSTQRRLRKNSN